MKVVHTTEFTYDGKAVASYNQARLTPLTTPEQIVVHSRVEVSPKPWVYEYNDYFGSHVTSFEVVDPHDHMTVTATSNVVVNRPPEPEPTLSWDDLASREVSDRWTEYLVLPESVAPSPDLEQRIKQIGADAARPADAAHAVCALVHEEVEFLPGSTTVRSAAAAVWQQRAGVCQDMVHLVIGGLRTLGIPARYVSGYRHPEPDPVIGETRRGDAHAWAEWFDDGWHALDPAVAGGIDDRYVTIAAGRDYHDVAPLRGIYSGAVTTGMDVTVDITRLP